MGIIDSDNGNLYRVDRKMAVAESHGGGGNSKQQITSENRAIKSYYKPVNEVERVGVVLYRFNIL